MNENKKRLAYYLTSGAFDQFNSKLDISQIEKIYKLGIGRKQRVEDT